jgi:hypothetical protein
MFLLCLIAALSGTPLRQAEAANDFIRAYGEPGHGDAIETIDGGVGDDSGAAIFKAGGDAHPLEAATLRAPADAFFTPLLEAPSLPNTDGRRWAHRSTPLAPCPARRHAWFQRFLF